MYCLHDVLILSFTECEDTTRIFRSPIITAWLSFRMCFDTPFIFLWFLERLLYTLLFILLDSKFKRSYETISESVVSNSTAYSVTSGEEWCMRYLYIYFSNSFSSFAFIYILVKSTVVLMHEIYQGIREKCKPSYHDNLYYNNPRGQKCLVVHTDFYKYAHIAFVSCVFYSCLTGLYAPMGKSTITDAASVFTSASCLWSMFLFVQLLPSMGHYVITIQRMLKILFYFAMMYILMMLPFSHILYKLLETVGDSCESNTFQTYMDFLHALFSIMLNIVDIRFYNVPQSESLFLYHFVFVFTIAILLINFLIALLSSEVTHIMQYKTIVLQIQRLSMMRTIEATLFRYPCFRKIYKCYQKRYFLCKDDHVYIVIKEPIRQ